MSIIFFFGVLLERVRRRGRFLLSRWSLVLTDVGVDTLADTMGLPPDAVDLPHELALLLDDDTGDDAAVGGSHMSGQSRGLCVGAWQIKHVRSSMGAQITSRWPSGTSAIVAARRSSSLRRAWPLG